ncbi:MAG: hypothetical protein EOO40_10140 [Deltaproteobacteria bacterium]|nr:MAG: hypothetical protein EOO40_10140 [Deltaproteobacteria bacterium]
MSELPAFFMEQAEAGFHSQFMYDVSTGRVIFVNDAYHNLLEGSPAEVDAELPACTPTTKRTWRITGSTECGARCRMRWKSACKSRTARISGFALPMLTGGRRPSLY